MALLDSEMVARPVGVQSERGMARIFLERVDCHTDLLLTQPPFGYDPVMVTVLTSSLTPGSRCTMNSKTTAKIVTSDRRIESAIALSAHGVWPPHAVHVAYKNGTNQLVVELSNGAVLLLPPQLLQGLEHATAEQLSIVQITGPGTGLHWPMLNIDHEVSGLLTGIFGTVKWMAKIGRKGGRSRSKAKRDAARRNGKSGGRPLRTATAR